jgi:hypothetical protein
MILGSTMQVKKKRDSSKDWLLFNIIAENYMAANYATI